MQFRVESEERDLEAPSSGYENPFKAADGVEAQDFQSKTTITATNSSF